ncbi:hypothetical protein [Ectobacillus polymachus]|uniref:hypothetical protein n=1 Tax=Ectobacillus polymachus TaxID=1508806 RepID=UPI003A89BD6D
MIQKIMISLVIVGFMFLLYLLSLLQLFPILLAVPLLFGSIVFSISLLNGHKRFRGFH